MYRFYNDTLFYIRYSYKLNNDLSSNGFCDFVIIQEISVVNIILKHSSITYD